MFKACYEIFFNVSFTQMHATHSINFVVQHRNSCHGELENANMILRAEVDVLGLSKLSVIIDFYTLFLNPYQQPIASDSIIV